MPQANNGHRPESISSQRASAGSLAGLEDPRVVQALEEYREAQERNETPDRRQLLEHYADVAQELAACLDALDFVQAAAAKFTSALDNDRDPISDRGVAVPQGILGDYQIIKEIGRGGMGVVYEAQQISLGRRVALKVLPFAAMLDPRQLTRFKNEAQASATLNHPNIVSVYAIGCDRSVHYFAMQYVAGQTLAEVVRDLRERDGLATSDRPDSGTISYLLTGDSDRKSTLPAVEPSARPAPHSAPTVRPPQAALSTQRATSATAFFQSVARLGIQAAEALDHAHQHGVLHRDVKPGNLMLDATGKLWVTDFGLARISGDAGMTMTGDLVGTLRYMSPEQALAKRVVVDHRSDIYSLGITLYELLTLRSAFVSDDRQELLRLIAFDDPTPPRTWNRAIPSDLETIVLKSMAKDARDRYATAQELADDLRRFLADQPIRARRLSLVQRAHKWSRRHRAVVTAAGSVAVCALVLGASLLWRERSLTLSALEEAQREREVARASFQQAQRAVDDYFTKISQSTLLDTPGMEPLRKELLESAATYYQTFVVEQVNNPALQAELAAVHIRLAQIYNQIRSIKWVDELARAIDIIEPLAAQGVDITDWKSLREGVLFKEYRGGDTGDETDPNGIILTTNRGIAAWEKLVRNHPDVSGFTSDLAGLHFINAQVLYGLGNRIGAKPSLEQAIMYWERLSFETLGPTRWLVLAMSHRQLADAYRVEQDWERSYHSAQRAIQMLTTPGRFDALMIDFGRGSFNNELSESYMASARAADALGRRQEANDARTNAVSAAREALAVHRKDFGDYDNRQLADHLNQLGYVLSEAGAYEEANKHLIKALAIRRRINDSDVAQTVGNLRSSLYQQGKSLIQQGKHKKAHDCYSQLLELNPADVESWQARGECFAELAQWRSAASDFAQASKLQPDSAYLSYLQAVAQLAQGDKRGYRETCATILRRFADAEDDVSGYFATWSCVLAADAIGDISLAIALAERTVEAADQNARSLQSLGATLFRVGRFDQAIKPLREADLIFEEAEDVAVGAIPAYGWFFLAMIHHRLGNDQEARKWYESAAAWMDKVLGEDEPDGSAKSTVTWKARVTLELLRVETGELLGIGNEGTSDAKHVAK